MRRRSRIEYSRSSHTGLAALALSAVHTDGLRNPTYGARWAFALPLTAHSGPSQSHLRRTVGLRNPTYGARWAFAIPLKAHTGSPQSHLRLTVGLRTPTYVARWASAIPLTSHSGPSQSHLRRTVGLRNPNLRQALAEPRGTHVTRRLAARACGYSGAF
jgi:hypothetical protein